MLKFWIGFVVGIGALFAAAALSANAGLLPVATNSRPLPMETWLAKTALHAKLRSARAAASPIPPSAANLQAGAVIFKKHRAVCHGMPHQPQSDIAAGMFPPPPQLWTPSGMVSDDPAGVTAWKVRNGIRLSGMPGFSRSLTAVQIWQVSLLLRNAGHIPAGVKVALAASQPAAN